MLHQKKSFETSIIVPCYNERATINLLLDALYEQTYPRADMEVVIADGGSTDGTREVIHAWGQSHPDLVIKVVDNHARIIPAALNTAIKASVGNIIVRLDAHSRPDRHYVERSVAALIEGRGQNVGGVWDIQSSSDQWMARSIAVAAGHPIGVGDARYRYSARAGYVDTVPFGAFKRELLEQVGLFDETLLSNEDYEFNTRIRQAGGKIWFDPQICTVYYARQNLVELARQYWRYGYWKAHMLRRYPHTIRWRQALPPLFVACLILLTLLSVFLRWAGFILAGVLGVYTLILMLTGLQLSVKYKSIALWLGVPLAIATMHFSWGTGFLWSLVSPQNKKKG
ncbi:MAG: glycosyltransferase family 2 protein [Chloroflexi bacterium]|nr:glycosyltransferase family 2 protein [Chloroflexota bacterium]